MSISVESIFLIAIVIFLLYNLLYNNYDGFNVGGKGKCTDGNSNVPGDQICEDSDNKVIHNNLFHCRRGGWEDDSYGKTPPRGAGPLPEDKELDTYNLYDYDWVNNKWIKQDEAYNHWGELGGGAHWNNYNLCRHAPGYKKDGGDEGNHVKEKCDASGYWKNGIRKNCISSDMKVQDNTWPVPDGYRRECNSP